jgi:hypothetical protein
MNGEQELVDQEPPRVWCVRNVATTLSMRSRHPSQGTQIEKIKELLQHKYHS